MGLFALPRPTGNTTETSLLPVYGTTFVLRALHAHIGRGIQSTQWYVTPSGAQLTFVCVQSCPETCHRPRIKLKSRPAQLLHILKCCWASVIMSDSITAYEALTKHLAASKYIFVCPSPETAGRVVDKRCSSTSTRHARNAQDFFGWSLPCSR